MLTVVIVSFMVDDMVHVMVLFFLGRSKDERVLHRHLRRRRGEAELIKVLETFGLMRLAQVCGEEFTYLATQNRVKKRGKRAASPPPLALEW